MLEKYKQNNPCYLQEFQAAIRCLTSIPTQQSKLNEYINKLTLPYFSFSASLISVCFVMKNTFSTGTKKVIKIKKRQALNLLLISLFSNAQQKVHPVKGDFFPTLANNWLTIIPVCIFHRLKRKIKSEEIYWNRSYDNFSNPLFIGHHEI